MIKRIGPALAVLIAALSLAAPAQARTLPAAEGIVSASAYWDVWHAPHRGYTLEAKDGPQTRLPARPREIRACGGGEACRTLVIGYYKSLYRLWMVQNRSLLVLRDSFPACGPAQTDSCVRQVGPRLDAVNFAGVTYIVRPVPGT